MNTLSVPFVAMALLAPATALSAQNLLAYRPDPASAEMSEFPCRSRAWQPGCTPGLVPGPYAAPLRPFAANPLGACTVDATTGVVYTTNGINSIQRRQYPRIGSSTGAALPNLPIPAVVGSVTGMAVDPVNKHLFLTNGTQVFEVDPLAGMAIVASWVAMPMNILAGLEYDPARPNRVFGVSTAAEIATYERGVGFLSAVSPIYPWPGFEATGLGLDKSDPLGGDFYVVHANGQVFHYPTGTLHTTLPANQVGMVYLPSKIELPSGGACGGAAPVVGTSRLVVDGAAGFGLEIGNLPLGTALVIWGIDVLAPAAAPACMSTVALPFGCGDTLWFPAPPTLFAALAAGTSAVMPLPLPAGFPGWTLIAQPALFCGACPAGLVLPNAMQLEISRG